MNDPDFDLCRCEHTALMHLGESFCRFQGCGCEEFQLDKEATLQQELDAGYTERLRAS